MTAGGRTPPPPSAQGKATCKKQHGPRFRYHSGGELVSDCPRDLRDVDTSETGTRDVMTKQRAGRRKRDAGNLRGPARLRWDHKSACTEE
jgi:hypothetical protein